jgi:hypothetical protein
MLDRAGDQERNSCRYRKVEDSPVILLAVKNLCVVIDSKTLLENLNVELRADDRLCAPENRGGHLPITYTSTTHWASQVPISSWAT